MIFRSSTLAFAVLFALEAPGSNAFQNGNPQQASKISNAPMPFKWPIVGTLPDFLNRGGVDGMSDVYESMYKEYGPTYGMSIMGEDETIFSDPRVFDQVLRKEGLYPVGGAESVTTFREYYEENNMELALKSIGRGPNWKEWRLSMNPDLYVLWESYLPSIADTCREISSLAGKEVTETKNLHVTDFLSRAAFDMFSTVLYGESPQTTNTERAKAEDIAFVSATKRAFDITGNLIASPLDKMFGSDLYKEFVVNMDKTMKFAKERGKEKIEAAIDTKAKYETNEKNPEEASESSGCPISAIQSKVAGLGRGNFVPSKFQNPSYIERLVNREELSQEEIAEAQGPLLMAGVDTTAYVMGWFYLNMASNPEIQTKLAKELHEKLQGADVTTVEQMESLDYLKACFRESHRLTPSAAISIKTLNKEIDVFSPLDKKSYTIPEGQRVSLNLRGLPMDPKYVENPTAFLPERFSPEAIESRKGTLSEIALDHPYMNDPFGRGKRRCLGANVAIAEMTVLAARLLQDWEITLVDANEAIQSPTKTWKSKQKLMLIADPYPAMEFKPRKLD